MPAGQASQQALQQIPHQQMNQQTSQTPAPQQGAVGYGAGYSHASQFSLPSQSGFSGQSQAMIQQNGMPGSQAPDMGAYPSHSGFSSPDPGGLSHSGPSSPNNPYNPNGLISPGNPNLGNPNIPNSLNGPYNPNVLSNPNNPSLSNQFAPLEEPVAAFEQEEIEDQGGKVDVLGLVASALAVITIVFMCMPWVQMAAESINSLGEIAGSAVGAELHIEPAYPVWALLGLNDQISTYSGIASFFTAGNDIVSGLEVFKVVVFISFVLWVVCVCALAANAIRCAVSRGCRAMGLFISACATSIYALFFIIAYSQMSVMTEGATAFVIVSLICSTLCAASAMLSRFRIF